MGQVKIFRSITVHPQCLDCLHRACVFVSNLFSSSLFLFCAVLVHVAQELESIQKLKKEPEDISKIGSESGDRDYKPHGLAQREAQGAYSRRSKRIMKEVCSMNFMDGILQNYIL